MACLRVAARQLVKTARRFDRAAVDARRRDLHAIEREQQRAIPSIAAERHHHVDGLLGAHRRREHRLRESHHLVAIAPLLGGDARQFSARATRGSPARADASARLEARSLRAARCRRARTAASQNRCELGGATPPLAMPICDGHHPRIGHAAQEGMVLEPPVRIRRSEGGVQARAPARFAPRSARVRTRPRAIGGHGGRWRRKNHARRPESRDSSTRMKSAGRVTFSPASASQIGSAAAPPGTTTRSFSSLRLRAGDPERRGRRARDVSQQPAIALEQRAHRGVGVHRARAHQQHRSIRDQRRKQIAAAGQRQQVAPVICRERHGNRDAAREPRRPRLPSFQGRRVPR